MNTQDTIRELAATSHLSIWQAAELWNRGLALGLTNDQLIAMRSYLPEAIELRAFGCSIAQITANPDKLGLLISAIRAGLVDPAQIPTSHP